VAATKAKRRGPAGKKTRPEQVEPAIPQGMQVEFICPKCGKSLCWALPGAEACCPDCGTWVTVKNRKKKGEDLLLPVDDDQLTLF